MEDSQSPSDEPFIRELQRRHEEELIRLKQRLTEYRPPQVPQGIPEYYRDTHRRQLAIIEYRLAQVEAMALQERTAGHDHLAYGWECRAAGIKEAIERISKL